MGLGAGGGAGRPALAETGCVAAGRSCRPHALFSASSSAAARPPGPGSLQEERVCTPGPPGQRGHGQHERRRGHCEGGVAAQTRSVPARLPGAGPGAAPVHSGSWSLLGPPACGLPSGVGACARPAGKRAAFLGRLDPAPRYRVEVTASGAS